MDVNLSRELRRAFELASLRRESVMLRWPDQVRKATETKLRCAELRAREKELYQAQYTIRVEKERQRLIDRAGAITRELKPPWAGEDRFSPADTLRQAQINVRKRHHHRIAAIDEYERRQLGAIVDEGMHKVTVRGKSREAFNRAADRRAGADRRQNRPRQRER